MSRVTAITNHQHELNMANDISHLLKNYSFDTLQKNLKNLTLVSLYAIYKQLSKIEQTQLLKHLPCIQKTDLTLLSAKSEPVIELLKSEQLLIVNINHSVAFTKTQKLPESVQPIVVVDDFNQYLGVVELHRLFSASDDSLISDLLSSVSKLHVSETQKSAAIIIANNNDHFAVLVDNQNVTIGLISLTDIIKKKAIQEEKSDYRPYLKTPVMNHVRQRIFWILGLAVVGLLSGMVIQSYDDAITSLIVLAFYMPMVADTGGNAGSQAATVIIRSIALGELKLNNLWSILYKELRISLFIGLGLACVSYLKVYFLSYGIELPEGLTLQSIALAIGLALFIQVITATLIGASLPLLVKWCNQDPAVVASPAITTIVDITGLLIYFYITSSFLF